MGFVGVGKGKLGSNINGSNEISFNPVFKPDDGVYLEKVSGRLNLIAKHPFFVWPDCMLGSLAQIEKPVVPFDNLTYLGGRDFL